MISCLLLYHLAKVEHQEAMGSRQARELKLQTKKLYFNYRWSHVGKQGFFQGPMPPPLEI